MLVASLYFFYASHNIFHLACELVTPNLFDIAAITELRQTWEDFDPNYMDEDTINFGEGKSTYAPYTIKHHDKTITDVLDEEHIALLDLWLSRCVFCLGCLLVVKVFLSMANQLHDGRKLGLNQMILASLYESLGELVNLLRAYKVGTSLLFIDPFSLLHLWLNAMLEASLPKKNHIDEEYEVIKNKFVEGKRLALLTP